jgi:predicted DNA-binding protein (UPF0251 family)
VTLWRRIKTDPLRGFLTNLILIEGQEKRVISVEDWAEIRRLHRAEQMPIRAIARQLGISKNTVKRALATDRPPVYSRPPKGSAVDAVEPQIRELLKQTPTMPATVIAERIGWERGMTVLKERVRELRNHCRADAAHPHHRRPDRRPLEASDRLECSSADAGLGQRGRDRPGQGDRGLRRVRGPARHPDLSLPASRSRSERAGGEGEWLSGDQLPARPHLHRGR